MFPCPPRRHFVHGQRGELSTLPVLFPILSQHAIPARVVEGKIQQFASRQGQHRRGEFFQCFGQALGSRHPVGDLEEQPVPVAFRRGNSLESDACFWHVHSSCTCRVQHVTRRKFEQELGVIAACQAVGLQFNGTVSQASVPFSWEPILFSPGRGAPSGSAALFPGLVPSRKRYCYSFYGSQASYTFVYNP